MKTRQLRPFAERQQLARQRAVQMSRQRCSGCGRLCRSARGNAGEYANCAHCGCSPANMVR